MNSKKKGNRREIQVAHMYCDAGWSEACTSRFGAPQEDHRGIDVVNVDPFAVQVKHFGKNLKNPYAVLEEIEVRENEIPVAHQKVDRKRGLVMLYESDWVKILREWNAR